MAQKGVQESCSKHRWLNASATNASRGDDDYDMDTAMEMELALVLVFWVMVGCPWNSADGVLVYVSRRADRLQSGSLQAVDPRIQIPDRRQEHGLRPKLKLNPQTPLLLLNKSASTHNSPFLSSSRIRGFCGNIFDKGPEKCRLQKINYGPYLLDVYGYV